MSDTSVKLAKIILEKFPKGITMSNMSEILIETMKLTGEYKTMSGSQKKQLVIDTLDQLFDRTDSGRYDKEIDLILKTTVPILIDNLVSVDKGNIKINPVVTSCGCLPKFNK